MITFFTVIVILLLAIGFFVAWVNREKLIFLATSRHHTLYRSASGDESETFVNTLGDIKSADSPWVSKPSPAKNLFDDNDSDFD